MAPSHASGPTPRPVSGDGFKVDFFCVGAAKAGTTSLHDLLDLQDGVALPRRKETNYFSFGIHGKPTFSGPLDQTSVNDATITSLDEYRDDFQSPPGCLHGEICPSYALPGVAQVLHAHNPDARIIILLREPVGRAFSNYQHLVRDGREPLSFEQALEAEDARLAQGWEWFWGLKRNSLYADLVEEYRSAFGTQQVRILFFEDFVSDQEHQLRSVMDFIGLDPSSTRYEAFDSNRSGVVSGRWRRVHRLLLGEGFLNSLLRSVLPTGLRKRLGTLFKSVSTVRGELSADTRERLAAAFGDDLESLDALVGGRVGEWRGGRDVP